MAKNTEEILLTAKDEATAKIAGVAAELGGLGNVLTGLATKAGPVGLGLAAIAAAALGVVSVAAPIAGLVEQLDKLAERTGVSSDRLQVLKQIISESGGNAEAMTTALTFLNRAIATQDPLLGKLGITTKDTFSAFMQLSEIFSGSADTAKKTEIGYQLLGRGSAELLGVIAKLGPGFKDMGTSMRANGALLRIKSTTVPWARDIVAAFNDVYDAVGGKARSPLEAKAREIEKIQNELAGLAPFRAKLAEHPTLGMITSGQSLADVDKRIADLQRRLDRLRGIRAETEEEERAIWDAFVDPPSGDSLAKVTLTPEEKTKKDARAERIAELARVMRVTTAEATLLAAALDRIEDARKATSISESLRLGPDVPAEIAALNREITETAEILGVSREEATRLVEAVRTLGEANKFIELNAKLGREYGKDAIGPAVAPPPAETAKRSAKDSAEEFGAALNSMLDMANVLDATFSAVLNSLADGFQTVFQNILAGTATVGSALKELWHSITNAILAELARLAAVAVLKVVGQALGIPGFGAAGASAVATTSSATFSSPGVAAVGSDRQIVNVYSYDLRDGLRDLASLGGSQRRASAQLAYLGEY